MPAVGLLSLPTDLIGRILNSLEPLELAALRASCRQLREAVESALQRMSVNRWTEGEQLACVLMRFRGVVELSIDGSAGHVAQFSQLGQVLALRSLRSLELRCDRTRVPADAFAGLSASLMRLKLLDLDSDPARGNLVLQSIAQCTRLEHLEVSCWPDDAEGPLAYGSLTALQQLTHLVLPQCPAEHMAVLLAELPHVVIANLHFSSHPHSLQLADAQLQPLRHLAVTARSLRELHIAGNFQGEAASAMRLPPGLTVCTLLCDDPELELADIWRQLPPIRALRVTGSWPSSATVLDRILQPGCLVSLEAMSWPDRPSHSLLAAVTGLTRLWLDWEGQTATADSVQAADVFTRLGSCRELTLPCSGLASHMLAAAPQLTPLLSLGFVSGEVTASQLAALACLKQLHSLAIRLRAVGDMGVEDPPAEWEQATVDALAQLTALTHLDLLDRGLEYGLQPAAADVDVAPLGALQRLNFVRLPLASRGHAAACAGWRRLRSLHMEPHAGWLKGAAASLTALTRMCLAYETPVVDLPRPLPGLRLLAGATWSMLRCVQLSDLPMGGAELADDLRAMPYLQSLELTNMPEVESAAVAALSPELRELSVEHCGGLRPGALQHLSALGKLSKLELSNVEHLWTDEALGVLGAAMPPQLQELLLNAGNYDNEYEGAPPSRKGSSMTDAGIAALLRPDGAPHPLRSLALHAVPPSVTEDGVAAAQRSAARRFSHLAQIYLRP